MKKYRIQRVCSLEQYKQHDVWAFLLTIRIAFGSWDKFIICEQGVFICKRVWRLRLFR